MRRVAVVVVAVLAAVGVVLGSVLVGRMTVQAGNGLLSGGPAATGSAGVAGVDGPAAVRMAGRINLLGDMTSDIPYPACSATLRQLPSVEAQANVTGRTSVTGTESGTFGRGGTGAGTRLGCVRNGILNIVVADLDGDSLPEIVTHRVSGVTQIAWNDGGRFSTVTVPALSKQNEYDLSMFVPATGGQAPPPALKLFEQMTAVGVVDANDDGHLDLVLLPSTEDGTLRLLLMDGTRNVPADPYLVTSQNWPGVPDTIQVEDVNGDGIGDLLYTLRTNLNTFSTQDVYAVRLFSSTGGVAPYFREETAERMPKNFPGGNVNSPREAVRSSTQRQPLQPFSLAPADYDNDGDVDVFVGGEVSGSRFYRQDDGVWVDVTDTASIRQSSAGMGTRALDIDDDGNMDVFSTENTYDYYSCPYSSTGCRSAEWGNVLFRGDGRGVFEDVAPKLGLNHTGFAWGFSSTDLNADGYLDFFIGTGDLADEKAQATWEGTFEKPFLMLGGPAGWVDRTGDVFREIILPGSTVVVGSADFDGDLRADLLVMGRESSAPLLLVNRTETGRPAGLLVRGSGRGGSPRFGEGARVRVEVPGRPAYSFTVSGFLTNYKLQSSGAPIPLGLGDADHAEVTVSFPSGKTVTKLVRAGDISVVSEPT